MTFGQQDLEEFRRRLSQLRDDFAPPSAAGEYVAHTDGACLGNPEGAGGWAAVMDPSGEDRWPPRWLLFGHLSSTSNNRAEALGLLAALEWTPPNSRLTVHSDSELTLRILEGRYKAKKNVDIWAVIRATTSVKNLQVSGVWLRGHAGDPLNELADKLSKLGALNRAIEDADLLSPVPAPAQEPPELVGVTPRTDWERDFVRSIADQLRRGRALSPKQQTILDGMRARGPAR